MVTLTIKKSDGSVYWIDQFQDQASCDKWIANEQTQFYWDRTYTFSSIDTTPDPSIAAAAKAAQIQLAIDQNARLQLVKAVINATPGTLTNVQRDSILIHLVKQALGQ